MVVPRRLDPQVIHRSDQATYVLTGTKWPDRVDESVKKVTRPTCHLMVTSGDKALFVRTVQGLGRSREYLVLPSMKMALSHTEHWEAIRLSGLTRSDKSGPAADEFKAKLHDSAQMIASDNAISGTNFDVVEGPSFEAENQYYVTAQAAEGVLAKNDKHVWVSYDRMRITKLAADTGDSEMKRLLEADGPSVVLSAAAFSHLRAQLFKAI